MSRLVEITGYQAIETLKRAERRGNRSSARMLMDMFVKNVLKFLGVITICLFTIVPATDAAISGYFEATAVNGWTGPYVLHIGDGVVSGTAQIGLNSVSSFSALPLVIYGCELSQSCTEWNDSTMSVLVLNLFGSAVLGTSGTVEWRTQGPRLIAGNPSPTIAVLGDVFGTVGGVTLTGSFYDFTFNATLTASFESVPDGQALSSIRIDFNDSEDQPVQYIYWDGYTWCDVGVPVALGTGSVSQTPIKKVPPKGNKSQGRK